jgi:hypothetical protein
VAANNFGVFNVELLKQLKVVLSVEQKLVAKNNFGRVKNLSTLKYNYCTSNLVSSTMQREFRIRPAMRIECLQGTFKRSNVSIQIF